MTEGFLFFAFILNVGVISINYLHPCSVSVNVPVDVDAVGFELQTGCMWAGFTVVGLRAVQGRHAGVAVGGPVGRRAEGGAQGRQAVCDGRRVAQRVAVEGRGSVAVVALEAAVRVQRADADDLAVHAQGGAVRGGQGARGHRPV